jgi:hypothetical protein
VINDLKEKDLNDLISMLREYFAGKWEQCQLEGLDDAGGKYSRSLIEAQLDLAARATGTTFEFDWFAVEQFAAEPYEPTRYWAHGRVVKEL